MAKIDIRQLDEFSNTFTDDVEDKDLAVWNDITKEFEPKAPSEVVEIVVFRRAMMLMGA